MNKNLGYTLSSEAWALVMLHDAKNALAKCQEPLEIAKRQNDTSQILVLSQYIASIYTFGYHNAQAAFTFLDSVYRQYNRDIVPVDDYSLWGYIHLKTGDLKTAAYYISKADSITDNLYVLSGYHALQSAYLEEEKRYKEALSAYKLSAELKDSAYMAEKEHLIQDLERRYKTQSLQNSLNLLKTKEQYQFVIMALLGIIFAIVIVIILRRIAKDKKKRNGNWKNTGILSTKCSTTTMKSKTNTFFIPAFQSPGRKTGRFQRGVKRPFGFYPENG